MIRVLTFGRYSDDNFGGLERYVFELARALQADATFTNIVALRGGEADAQNVTRTVYARPIAHLAGVPICPTMPLQALRMHRAQPFDIVHLQFPADPMAHLSAMLLPSAVRRVITWHSDIVRQNRLAAIYEPFLRRLIKSAAAVVIPTPAHVSPSGPLARWATRERIHVVPFGLDYRRFMERPPLAEEIRRRYAGRFLLFALGRHVYYKGFEYLITALARLPEMVLMLGGRGPLSNSLQTLAERLEVGDRVNFLGRITDTDLPAYYHACDVFCLPSIERSEAFGIVQLEAMACAKPVVCCELGNGVTWVNQHEVTGLVVPPGDVDALCAALRRLHGDASLRGKLGANGQARALTKFSVETMSEATLAVYRSVLAA